MDQLAASFNQMAGNLQQMIEHMHCEAERGSDATELSQAMDMADSEPQAYDGIALAKSKISRDHAMALLVADSRNAHLACAGQHPKSRRAIWQKPATEYSAAASPSRWGTMKRGLWP